MQKNLLISLIQSHPPVLQPETAMESAVLVIVIYDEHEKMSLLVTRRSNTIAYAGDYCFPGGIKEASDLDCLQTVKREMQEELGLLEQHYQIIGQLDNFVDRHGNRVTPFVALMRKTDFAEQASVSEDEIADIYFFPLEELKNIGINAELEQVTRRHPSYLYVNNQVKIWGLTASIMVDFANIIFRQNRPVGKKIISQI